MAWVTLPSSMPASILPTREALPGGDPLQHQHLVLREPLRTVPAAGSANWNLSALKQKQNGRSQAQSSRGTGTERGPRQSWTGRRRT